MKGKAPLVLSCWECVRVTVICDHNYLIMTFEGHTCVRNVYVCVLYVKSPVCVCVCVCVSEEVKCEDMDDMIKTGSKNNSWGRY